MSQAEEVLMEKIAYLKTNMGDILIDVEVDGGEVYLHFIKFVLQVSLDELHVSPIRKVGLDEQVTGPIRRGWKQ